MSLNVQYWAFQTAAMMITAFLIPRLTVSGPIPALLTVLTLGFINSHIWNAALFFNIPDSFTSQALVLFLTNGIIFWLVVKLLPGIEVRGILPALLAPIVFTATSLIIAKYGQTVEWGDYGNQALDYIKSLKSYVEPAPTPKSALQLINALV